MKIDQEEYKETNRRTYSDEIDLREVFRMVGNGFQSIGKALGSAFRMVLRRFKLISFFVLVGMGLGYGAYYVTKPYYTSSMTLVLAEIRNIFVENQLERLSEMVKEDNFEAVAENLDISLSTARGIKKMTFTNIDQERVAEDSVLMGSPFEIELEVYDNKMFSSMEPALVNYLENNRYFSKQKRINQRKIENLITKLDSEIKSIDSLKTTVSSPRGPVSGFVYGEPIDPTNLYRESITMYQQQVDLEADLEQLDNIQVVNGFTPRLRPTGPSLSKYLAIGGFVAFLVGLVVALNFEIRKKNQQLL